MEPSATSTIVTGPIGKRLQAGTEDAPVLDRPAPLRRFHDSGATYLTHYRSFQGRFYGSNNRINSVIALKDNA